MNKLRWQIVVPSLMAFVFVYWFVGSSAGAGLVRSQMHEVLAGTTDQTLALDHLRFNPFTMTAGFEGLRLNDTHTDPVLTVARGRLKLTATGLFVNDIVISTLVLEQPYLSVIVSGPVGNRRFRSLGSLRFAGDSPEKPRPIRIRHAQVEDGRVIFVDESGPVSRYGSTDIRISDINVELTDLVSDEAVPALFHLTAKAEESGTLSLQGTWLPISHTVNADVELGGLTITPFVTLFDFWRVDALIDGMLTARGKIQYAGKLPAFNGELLIDRLSVNDVTGQPLFSADRLTAHGVTSGGDRWPESVQWVELDRPAVVLTFDDEGISSLRHLKTGRLPRIDKITAGEGRIDFTDTRLRSSVQIDTRNITGEIARSSDGPQDALTVRMNGEIMEQGVATIDGVLHGNGNQVQAEGDASVRGVDAGILSPYFSSLTTREISRGALDLDLHYRKNGPALTVSSTVSLHNPGLGNPAEESPPFGLPLDLTIALLTDEHYRMTFELPLHFASIDSGDTLRQGFEDALKGLINATVAEPVTAIAGLAGVDARDLDIIEFEAGSAEILPAAESKLAAWAEALAQRPLLEARATGHFAASGDRVALARRQVGLHIALATSARTDNLSAPTEPDYSDAKVQAVLDEFALARLTTIELNRLKTGAQEDNENTRDEKQQSYYRAVFEALAAKESVSDYALRQLARYRARSTVNRLQELGIEAQRLAVDPRAVVESDDSPATVALTLAASPRPDN